ncbi:methyl-accepting chemotaxis protein [Paenibacillus sp. CAU 1782]
MSGLKQKKSSSKKVESVEKKGGTKPAKGSVAAMFRASIQQLKETRFGNPIKSVGIRLLLLVLAGTIGCVVAVGLSNYSKARELVEENVSEASYQTVKQVASKLGLVLQNYSDLSLQIMIDKDVRDALEVLSYAKEDAYAAMAASREVSDRLSNYVLGNSNISGAAILPTYKEGAPISGGLASIASTEDFTAKEWFQQTIEDDGKTKWINPQPDGIIVAKDASSIAISRLLKINGTETGSYVLVIELPLEKFMAYYGDVDLGQDSRIAIMNTAGKYVANDDLSLVGGDIGVVGLTTTGEGDRTTLKTTDDLEVLAAYHNIPATDWQFLGLIPVERLAEQASVIRNHTWLMVGLASLVAVGIGALIIVLVGRPLVRMRNLMLEGAKGNLTVQSVLDKRSDEIGDLARSFNEMMTQIKTLAQQTTKSAVEVLSTATELSEAAKKTSIAAKEIAVATEEIANGATSLAVEAEKSTDLTVHMDKQMKEVQSANSQMSVAAQEVEKAGEQGTTYMNQLIEKTGTTESMTRSMVEKVDALKDSTGSIVKILDVLNNLAKQTNILSLNATIEAARAGAAGKGFMVVADEIRKLADQSRQSIDVVAQITAKIQGEIDETVSVLSDAYPMFQEQIQSVKHANSIFVSVQEQMAQLGLRLEEVTGSVSELAQSQVVMSDAMTSVSAVAEESSATSEEVASLSGEQLSISESLVRLSGKLDTVSHGLKDSLSRFKME